MKVSRWLLVASLLIGSCADAADSTVERTSEPTDIANPSITTTVTEDATASDAGSVRLLFAGDVMLGRRVGPVAAAEGAEFMEAVRFVVSSSDFAAANLESPLTERPHVADTPNQLAAEPDLAPLLRGAGFDVMSVANNHATDSGRQGLIDTLDALEAAGVASIGGGSSIDAATSPVIEAHDGVTVAFLAFDATHIALEATAAEAGVVGYEPGRARAAVAAAASAADVVAVSVHGGVEYLLDRDPILTDIADDLVGWGADIVWGHGPHVPQPVSVVDSGADRSAIVATSLGNFVFDQKQAPTQTGLLLEVLVSSDGVIAHRVGRAEHADLRPSFVAWDPPLGPAVLLDGEWWSLARPPDLVHRAEANLDDFSFGDVTTAAVGDATGDGRNDLVVSFRRPFEMNQSNQVLPARDWMDASGRSAHLGVFEADTMRQQWIAGTMLRPVADIAVCDGAIALAFDSLDDPTTVATSAWVWWDFGFAVADELPGAGRPGCVDVDRDGVADPVIVDRGAKE
ncbi:MAG: CapA family protein [Acidimicrobiia bacterium]|nr:CapA family protein [Acidimicrobiia bacterium]